MSHTPEPWILFEVGDRFTHKCPASKDKTSILTTALEGDVQFGAVYNDADAERIVACVNACAGIPTEILILDEKAALANRSHVEKLRNDKEVMLASLNKIASFTQSTNLLWWQEEARKAIEVVKGGE